jgi:hypothetical protein
MMFRSLAISLLVLAGGCVGPSIEVTPLHPASHPLAPRALASIVEYKSTPNGATALYRIVASGGGAGELHLAVRDKAAALGCDGVVITSDQKESHHDDGAVPTGQLNDHRTIEAANVSAVCVVVEPTADPAALAAADAVIAATGGAGAWDQLRQLTFVTTYAESGAVRGRFEHRWDRWHGRHAIVMSDDGGRIWVEVRYDQYNESKLPFARNRLGPLDDKSTAQMVQTARGRLTDDGGWLTIIHRLRDPGVHLAVKGQINDVPGQPDACKPSCDSIEVTFDPGAGAGTWHVDVNSETHKPEIIEKDGGAALIAGWTETGGLSWPTKLVSIGNTGQTIELSEISTGPIDTAFFSPPHEGDRDDASAKQEINGRGMNPTTTTVTPPPKGNR